LHYWLACMCSSNHLCCRAKRGKDRQTLEGIPGLTPQVAPSALNDAEWRLLAFRFNASLGSRPLA